MHVAVEGFRFQKKKNMQDMQVLSAVAVYRYTREPAWFCAGTMIGTPPMREMLEAVTTEVGISGRRGA